MANDKSKKILGKTPKSPKSNLSIFLIGSVLLLMVGLFMFKSPRVIDISETTLKQMVLAHDIEKIYVVVYIIILS